MTKKKLLQCLIFEINNMELHHRNINTFAQSLKFINPDLTHQDRGVMELHRWMDDGGGWVTWCGNKKNLNEFEMLLLEGLISANYDRVVFEEK